MSYEERIDDPREETVSDEGDLPCPICHKNIDMTDRDRLEAGDYVWCNHCDGEVEITAVDYSVTYYARRRDLWLDFWIMLGRIGRLAARGVGPRPREPQS